MYPKELSESKKEYLEVLNSELMEDKTEPNGKYENATIRLRYEKPFLFGLSGQMQVSKAMTVCRKSPLLPTGIKTLNMFLDPSKEGQRMQTVAEEKLNWHTKFSNLNFSRAYEKLFELFWYSRLPCFDVRNVTSKDRDEMSVIKRCYWQSKLVDCASIFVARSSDRGMCCAFNVGRANQIYRSTKYRIEEEKMQEKTRENSFPGG